MFLSGREIAGDEVGNSMQNIRSYAKLFSAILVSAATFGILTKDIRRCIRISTT